MWRSNAFDKNVKPILSCRRDWKRNTGGCRPFRRVGIIQADKWIAWLKDDDVMDLLEVIMGYL